MDDISRVGCTVGTKWQVSSETNYHANCLSAVGARRNVEEILAEVELVVTPEVHDHINRILTQGCP